MMYLEYLEKLSSLSRDFIGNKIKAPKIFRNKIKFFLLNFFLQMFPSYFELLTELCSLFSMELE
jgi:hypothetical protein